MKIMDRIIFEIEEDIESGGFIAEANLPNNEHIVTEGDTLVELKAMIKDALICHFDNEATIPQQVILKFVKQEVLHI